MLKFKKNEEMVEAKAALNAALTEGDDKAQAAALESYLDIMQKEVASQISHEVNATSGDKTVLSQRGANVLTSAEKTFFNAVIDAGGFETESILPVTTQERIFEDLVKAHPLLQAIGLKDMGAVTRIITSNPSGAAVWGKLMGDIQGQIGAAFDEVEITQNKLTAFAIIPNDMLDLGPEWVERYVRTVIAEALSVGLEEGFLNGQGQGVNQPIGLLKDVDSSTGAVTDKTATGDLTFESGKVAVEELADVYKTLSRTTDAQGAEKIRNVAGKVSMVINPLDHYDLLAATMIQNQNGTYVANVPFNPEIVESDIMPEGQVLFFVKGEYLAALAGGYQLKRYDQTLAMEDAMLYTIKQFAHGEPLNNDAAKLYNIVQPTEAV